MRAADTSGRDERRGKDPEATEAEARAIQESERALAADVAARADALSLATDVRTKAEAAHAAAEKEYSGALRAIADRREGLARLTGEVNSLRSKVEAADAEIARLTSAGQEALARAEAATRRYTALETELGAVTAGESGLDDAYEAAEAARLECESDVERLKVSAQDAAQRRASLSARLEGLRLGLERRDGFRRTSGCV
ncbi:hypothetical protein [Propioniciclava flava]